MVDTIRDLPELNALLADNTSGSISPQDIRDLMVSMMCHAELGSAAKAAITLGTGYQALDFDSAGVAERGFTADAVNKKITGTPVDMKVQLHLEVLFKGSNNQDYDFTVFKNPDGTPSNILRMERAGLRILNASQTFQAAWSATVQLSAGDELQAAVRSNGNNFELLFGVLRVQRIGVE